jgi:endonuclease/exonuclease/phosphatase family metal-dependent hydrolase
VRRRRAAWHAACKSICMVSKSQFFSQKGIPMKRMYLMKNVLSHPALRPIAYVLVIAALLVSIVPVSAGSKVADERRTIDTMTMNLYIGAGVERVMQVDQSDTEALVEAVTEVYYELVASNPKARLQAVADQIADRRPDIVAVQEATLLRVQSPGDIITGNMEPNAETVVFDYLKILVDALKARGAHYAVVSASNEWDIEMPMLNMQTGAIDDVRQTDREAILIRTDHPRDELKVSHPRHGNFINSLQPIPGSEFSLTRGWCSVDVSTQSQKFRYISVHLEEEFFSEIQKRQVDELLGGPAHTTMPVIVAGDFNSDPFNRDIYSGALAYNAMRTAGHFTDTWAVLHPHNRRGGLTWGHDEYLADRTVHFNRRIDFVFFRGCDFDPLNAEPIDIEVRHAKGRPPLWASDHAALVASLQIKDR